MGTPRAPKLPKIDISDYRKFDRVYKSLLECEQKRSYDFHVNVSALARQLLSGQKKYSNASHVAEIKSFIKDIRSVDQKVGQLLRTSERLNDLEAGRIRAIKSLLSELVAAYQEPAVLVAAEASTSPVAFVVKALLNQRSPQVRSIDLTAWILFELWNHGHSEVSRNPDNIRRLELMVKNAYAAVKRKPKPKSEKT